MKRRKLKIALAGVIAFVLGFLTALRSAPAQTERFDTKVREFFFAGFNGDLDALARGMKACDEILAKNPKDPEALVWHGSGLTFQSGQAFMSGDQQKGMELWTKGIAEMKTAKELAPENVAVLIPRGADLLANSRFVPPEMANSLIKEGIEDYEKTYQIQKSYFDTLGTHPRGELLFGLAEGYSRLGDEANARKYFELTQTALPDTAYAKRAAVWLQTKSIPADETRCIGCHVTK